MSDCVYAVMRVFMPCHHRRGSFQGVVIWCQTIMLVAVWLWTLPIQIKTFLLYFKPASQSWSKDNYYLMSFCQHAIVLSYFFLQQRYLSVHFTNQAVVCFWVGFFVVGGRDSWEGPVAVEKEKWKCLGHGMWHVARSLLSSPLTIMIHQGFICSVTKCGVEAPFHKPVQASIQWRVSKPSSFASSTKNEKNQKK